MSDNDELNSLLSHKESLKTIYDWNKTEKEYPDHKTLQTLFEEQVEKTPETLALVYEEVKFTYEELNEKANQFAHYLINTYEIKPDTLIALCLERSERMIITILAVLKAGAAYVPIDPKYPRERIQYILQDTNTKIFITDEVYQNLSENLVIQPKTNPKTSTTSSHLAYIIYTSGTTGKPKGVMIEHQGVTNNAAFSLTDIYDFSKGNKITAFASYAFDSSIQEFYTSLLRGGELHLLSEHVRMDAEKISDYIVRHKINYIYLPPVLLATLPRKKYETLQAIVYAGEPCDLDTAQHWSKHYNLYNCYGPTETTVNAAYKKVEKACIKLIGSPIANMKCYVLDQNLKPMPIGEVGELYIGGVGLARGYLNRPDLTAERFIKNPFQTDHEKQLGKNSRLYKTGDLVRWLPDGNLEYSGRIDFQVKIRGFRIELGEIENLLNSYEEIQKSVVIAKEHSNTESGSSGNKYLVGYYVAHSKLDEEKIFSYLHRKLPEYMVPTALVHLEKIPLTINGKIDKNALPEPKFKNEDTFVSPRNDTEQTLCKFWAEVLGLSNEHIGIRDNFFRLGGNSILAIRLMNKLNKNLNTNLSVSVLFKENTIEKLAQFLKNANPTDSSTFITKANVSKIEEQALSFAQERLWFIDKYEGGTHVYNLPAICQLSPHINIPFLEQSLKDVVSRHEILRTLIKEDNAGNSYQCVLDEPLKIKNVSVKDKIQLDQMINKEINHVYNLDSEYPIRVCVYELNQNDSWIPLRRGMTSTERYLSIVIHHIAFDGWSVEIFFNELEAHYAHYQKKSNGVKSDLELPILNIQYKDFSAWQRNYLTGMVLQKQLSFWKTKLSGYETLHLRTDKQRPDKIDYRGQDIYFNFDKNLSEELRELAKKLKVSLYSLLLSGYFLMLKSYSYQDDLVIGTPIANRHFSQIENLVGFFVNTLVLRVNIDSQHSIVDFIQKLGSEIIEIQHYQDLPFEKLVAELNVTKDTSRHPIFQIMFGVQNFDNYPDSQKSNQISITDNKRFWKPYKPSISNTVAKFDISTFIDDSQIQLKGVFNFATSLYNETTISGFIETYLQILKQIVHLGNQSEQKKQIIADLTYLTPAQYKQIFEVWNNTERDVPSQKTIHSLFEEQVNKTPAQIALVYEETKLTYQELNERSNQLAHYLKNTYNIQPDSFIALCLNRTERMIIAILGVLKAGGAYVPIDPKYPEDRIQYILQDTKAPILLTDEVYQNLHEKFLPEHIKNPLTATKCSHLAYIIYTSGTTGKPKGVMIEHRGAINNAIFSLDHIYDFSKGNKTTAFASYAFDASVYEFFISLLRGGELHLLSEHVRADVSKLSDYILRHKIHYLDLPAVILTSLPRKKYETLNGIVYAGEPADTETVDYWSNNYNLYNAYGPTETSVCATFTQVINGKVTSIGSPIANTTCYVLDSNLQPLPMGALGELFIGGIGVARGYLNRPDLTIEKFIENPFQTEKEKELGKNRKLYKTGDLVRWLHNGHLEFIGRTDFQVKIRGFRIELPEIENVLNRYEELSSRGDAVSFCGGAGSNLDPVVKPRGDTIKITQSVVIAKEHTSTKGSLSGNKYLAAYYVSASKLDEEKIFSYLQSKLPDYMVPTALIHLEKIPITINGKIDKKALPEPKLTNEDNFLAPRNEVETKLCKIWAEVLGLSNERVGIRDDFFKLGGNSILAIRLMSKLNKELKTNLTVSALFKENTIEKLSEFVTLPRDDSSILITQSNVSKIEEQVLSFAQERLWFIEKFEEGTHAYNIPIMCKLLDHVQPNILEQSIKDIVSRHEVLRTLIKEDNAGKSYQFVVNKPLNIKHVSVKTKAQLDEMIYKEINHVYNLGSEYPIRVCLYELNHNERFISIVIHHIAFDGWSVDLFLNELDAHYEYYQKKSVGLEVPLKVPKLDIQYKDFSLWQRNYLKGEIFHKQLNFWKNKLNEYDALNLRTDKPRPSKFQYHGKDIYFELDGNLSFELRELAKTLKISLHSLLAAGYFLMLRCFSYQNDLVIGMPIANRHYSQIENLLGFFVNSLALRIQIDKKSSLSDFIRNVGSEIVEAQSYQDLPFEKLVAELNVTKDAGRHPIFQVMFGVQSFGGKIKNQKEIQLNLSESKQPQLFEAYEAVSYSIAKFDMTTFIDDSQTQLKGVFNYATSLYTEKTIAQFIKTYTQILKQFSNLANPPLRKNFNIADLNYISQSQYQLMIETWNKTEKEYPSEKTLHALFEEQVEKTPNNIILVYEKTKLTYKELNERSNQLAHYLKNTYNIKPDTLIALCLNRSERMLIAILGVLKAGGAYVPIDPKYPSERIQYILEDTQSPLLLTDEMYQNLQEKCISQKITNPFTDTTSSHLAYVIYTSGTTGKPKGVMLEHKGVTNNAVFGLDDIYDFRKGNKITCLATYAFDASVPELFLPLLKGGELHLLSEDVRTDVSKISDYILRCGIHYMYLPPVLLAALPRKKYDSIRGIVYAGEPADIETVRYWSKNCNLYNCYGPTESSVNATNIHVINENATSIGFPIPNTKCYVLDSNLKPLPIGAVGELHIGGAGVARGYLNRPELTAEKFIVNPFQTGKEKESGKNGRLYKTGDLVRWLPDGSLDYIGRIDFQVKIRGFRIELSEIENVLNSYEVSSRGLTAGSSGSSMDPVVNPRGDNGQPRGDTIKITRSIVIAKDLTKSDGTSSGNKYLAGYYVSSYKLDEEKIFAYLQSKLPEYMIPSALVHLEKIPLTNNGKVDKKALPEPKLTNENNFVAPRNEVEKKICKIWVDVLGLSNEHIGIRDNFFRLGGNSILAIRLTNKLNKELGTNLSVSVLFKENTVEKLSEFVNLPRDDSSIFITKSNVSKEEQVLSFAQERLWFIEKYEQGTHAYNIPILCKLFNHVQLNHLEQSIKDIVSRHEILRTLIKEDSEGKSYQFVMNEPLTIKNVSVKSKANLDEMINKEINHVYNLGSEYPIRVCVYELNHERYISIVIHHIAFDGWSVDLFLNELEMLYEYYQKKSQGIEAYLELPKLNIQYKDFSIWQRNYLKKDILEKQIAFWKNKLNGYETLNLRTDKPRPSQFNYKGKNAYFELDTKLSNELRKRAKEFNVSLYSLLASGYFLMLRIFSGQNDLVIGMPVANRHYSQIEHLIGFFVNSLALRIQVDPKGSLSNFIQRVGSEIIEAQSYQDLPFEKLVAELNVTKDASRHPVFQVMFGVQSFGNKLNYQVIHTSNLLENNRIALFKPYLPEGGIDHAAKFDLSTFIDDSQKQFKGVFNYATGLYSEETILQFIETYTQILEQFANLWNETQNSIAHLKYMTQSKYQQTIEIWNKTEKEYPSEKTLQALFEKQVDKTPTQTALVYEETKLSYQELNEKSNQIAHYLKNIYHIKPDTLIALCLERSERILIAILGVLKSGGAFVPIDPKYPEERIQYILQDTHSPLLLTDEIYENLQEKFLEAPITNPVTSTTSSHLAYVIYTSGTTGKPKGVMIEHKAITNLLCSLDDIYDLSKGNKVAAFSAYTFDPSIQECFVPLINGGELHLLSESVRTDIGKIEEYITRNHIHYLPIAPVLLPSLPKKQYPSLKAIIYGGETCDASTAKYWAHHYKLYNCYGPSETAIQVAHKQIFDGDVTVLGSPNDNAKCYVLDSNLTPLPIGAVGELHIGGVQLARGYLNQANLTAEKFISNPFQTEAEKQSGKNEKLYKTGDLVKWLPNGTLEYIGRTDFQLKIRGFRIELGEIENVLNKYFDEGIKITQSVVVAKEHPNTTNASDNKYLVGYYVANSKLDEEKIFAHLQARLPDYMVPSSLVYLKTLPLTINGKIDQKSLPDPEWLNENSYLAPRNDLEKTICRLWAELLGIAQDKIGVKCDFFRLGGNSILGIRLASKINQELEKNLSVSVIFKHNTVEKLAMYLSQANEKTDHSIVISKAMVKKVEDQCLSFAQERLWFIERYEGGTNAYNIPLILKLSNHIKFPLLEQSIKDVVSRHEILRTLIKEDKEGNIYQFVVDEPLIIHKIQVKNKIEFEQTLNQEFNHIYDLTQEYPIRIFIIEVIENAWIQLRRGMTRAERYISFVIHHIAFDGWSVDLFLNELEKHYDYYKKKAEGSDVHIDLKDLKIQYKDFAIWQRNYLTGDVLNKQLSFWKHKLNGYETLNLKTDKPRQSKINYLGKNIYFDLSRELSCELRELAKDLKVSLYSLLLAGYFLMLKIYSNQDDLVIGTPIANRHFSQIENLIGFFVNTLALRINVNSKQSIVNFIQNLGREIVEAQNYQDLPFEKLVAELNVTKETGRHPIFQIIFGVQNFGNNLDSQALNLISQVKKDHPFWQPYVPKNSDTVAKLDLGTFIDDSQIQLKGVFNFAVSLYEETTIAHFMETYIHVLKQFGNLTSNIEQKKALISDLTYITEDQTKQIEIWNQTEKEYPTYKTIPALFEEQVEKTPNNIALVYESIKLTYQELNEKSNQLAHYLKKTYNIQPNTLIALCLERSEAILIAILGVLKAGGAYAPIDPNYPPERIQHIFQDTHAPLLLTDEVYRTLQSKLNHEPKTNPITETTSEDLAYVIYTSGTTGKPKGVMIAHAGVINNGVFALTDIFDFQKGNKVGAFVSYTFDPSVMEYFTTLLRGGELHLFSAFIRSDMSALEQYVNENKINYLNIPAVLLTSLSKRKYETLYGIVSGGETCDVETAKYWSGHCILYNLYGPTETTIIATFAKVKNGHVTSIGSPIANMKCYVLDAHLKTLPIGAVGELYIGGIGVAKGYLNNLVLTEEKFKKNPFQTEKEKELGKNGKLYKTGDLVRWLQNGQLEFIGRTDFQVKIRGFRIELGEIENVLNSYEELSSRGSTVSSRGLTAGSIASPLDPAVEPRDDTVKPRGDRIKITQSVVLAKEYTNAEGSTANKYLVGYYVSSSKLDEEKLFAYLKTKLSDSMVPTALVHLEKLPLTVNGKIDREALPEPQLINKAHFVAPRNEIETKLCNIWAEVLGLSVDHIGIHDDFFRLGGNSIRAIHLIGKINNFYQSNLKLADIFLCKNIESIMKKLMQTKNKYQTIIKLNQSSCQRNMFMIHPGLGGCEVYISLAHKLSDNFNCYGIESYNLYHDEKIDNLNTLAQYYLNYIDEIMKETHQTEYYLLGWSLGGQIALEIASILEKKGETKIKMYLLDTLLISNKINVGHHEINYLMSLGYDTGYVERLKAVADTENKLMQCEISSHLNVSKVLLFKALLFNNNDELTKINEYISTLKYNNIDKFLKNLSQIQVMQLDSSHANLIKQEETLTKAISNFDLNSA